MTRLPLRVRVALWALAGIACLASIFWVIDLFSADTRYVAPDRGPVADITAATTYEKQIAAHLRENPVYVDPLMTSYAEGLVDDRVREKVVLADFPTYFVVLPSYSTSGPSARDDVMFARIIEQVGSDGIYFRLSPLGGLRHEVRDGTGQSIYIPDTYEVDNADLLRALDTADDKLAGPEEKFMEQPLVAGFLMGAMLAVPLWFLLTLVRRSARRDTTYLKGLK